MKVAATAPLLERKLFDDALSEVAEMVLPEAETEEAFDNADEDVRPVWTFVATTREVTVDFDEDVEDVELVEEVL